MKSAELNPMTPLIIFGLILLSIPLLFNMPILALLPLYLIASAQLYYYFIVRKAAPIWIKVALTLTAFLACAISVQAGGFLWIIAIFLFTLSLKLFELNSKRDIHFILLAALVLIASALLNFTNLWSGIYLILAVILLFGLFRFLYARSLNNEMLDSAPATGFSPIAKKTMLWALLSLPLTFLLFFTVPRIDPIGLLPPIDPHSQIGLSDHLTLDNVSGLQATGKIAFRAEFDQGPPGNIDALYWRMMTLEEFDGYRWDAGEPYPLYHKEKADFNQWQKTHSANAAMTYEIMMEPDNKPWLPSLQTPVLLTNNTLILENWTVERKDKEDKKRFRYRMAQYHNYTPYASLKPEALSPYLSVPNNINPRLSALGEQLIAAHLTPDDRVEAIKKFLSNQAVTYTTSPAPLPREDALDSFIYDVKQGYCEHFASTMAFLLRASSVPSRIVIGFAGGEWNPVGEYLIVRQDEAHAWVEYWIENQGWIAFDPTLLASTIISSRPVDQFTDIAEQVNSAANNDDYQSAFTSSALALNFDALNYQWYRWIVQYDQNSQEDLWQQAKKWNWYTILLITLSGILLAWVIYLAIKYLYNTEKDPLMRQWRLFEAFYQKNGIERQLNETAENFCSRIIKAFPENKVAIDVFKNHWMQLMYCPDPAFASEHIDQLITARKSACKKL